MIRAILCDTQALDLHYVELTDQDHLDQMYKLIKCSQVDRMVIRPDLDAWFDDEGLLRSPKRFVVLTGERSRPSPMLAGNVLLIGHDGHGETVTLPEDVTLEETKKHISFWVRP